MTHSYISYWEHDVWLKNIDIAIVGSGIVGLSSAYFIKKKHPLLKVVVFERGFLPHGATTRNAGFSCFGSVTEILSDIRKSGKEKAYELVKDRFDGLNALRHLHGHDIIQYENFGGYEIFTKNEMAVFENSKAQIKELNHDLQQVLSVRSDIYQIADARAPEDLGLNNVIGMFFNPWEGQIHSGLLVKNLVKICRELGVEIITGINIIKFESGNGEVHLLAENDVDILTKKLIITTNGFAKGLVPQLDVEPARGQVLVTTPIDGLRLKGTFHHHEGYDYFRNVGNRVLVGGGRDLDFEEEHTTQMDRNDKIHSYLRNLLSDTILPNQQFEIEYEWSGTMGVGESKSPIIEYVKDNVLVAVRMGGMGVAIGTNVGLKVAEMI